MAKSTEIDVAIIGDLPVIGGGVLPAMKFTRQEDFKKNRTIWRLYRQHWQTESFYSWKLVAKRDSRAELDRIVDKMIVDRIMVNNEGPHVTDQVVMKYCEVA